jgi:hypothetical protein
VHDNAGGLVEREQMIVFVQDIERHVFSGHRDAGCGWRERDRHDIAGGGACGGAWTGTPFTVTCPFQSRWTRASRRVDVGRCRRVVEPNACVAPIGGQDASG